MENNCTKCQATDEQHRLARKQGNSSKCACGHNARSHKLSTYRAQCKECECQRHHYDVKAN